MVQILSFDNFTEGQKSSHFYGALLFITV